MFSLNLEFGFLTFFLRIPFRLIKKDLQFLNTYIFNEIRVTAMEFTLYALSVVLCISLYLADAQCPRMHWITIVSFYPVIFLTNW